eukprot:104655_1
MSATDASTKWMELSSYPRPDLDLDVTIPAEVNRNNYIVIHQVAQNKACGFHKYNIDTDTWNKIDVFPEQNISFNSASLDVKKQILFLWDPCSMTQIQLSDNRITNITKNNHITECAIQNKFMRPDSIVIKNSLFLVGAKNSILKWDSKTKILTKYDDMYNKSEISECGMIYNNKTDTLLLFGGFDWVNDYNIDYILQYHIQKKEWNKLPISLPYVMGFVGCTMAINNKYILLFGGTNYNSDVYYDNIYIYSLKHKTIRESQIKC